MSQNLLILSLVCSIIFFVPLLCRKIHIPTIVGLILAGMLVGPYGLGWVGQSSAIDVFAEIGMLYIMFMSGLEQDVNDFRRNKGKVIVLGALTFIIPAILAFVGARVVLHYSWLSSCMLAAMLGSHTLMTYPIVSRHKLQKTDVVNIIVGSTVMAILLSLFSLAIISSTQKGLSTDWLHWVKQIGGIALFLAATLWLFPLLADWLLKRINDPLLEFLLVFLMMLAAALLAQVVGLEGILGAFLVGVQLNKHIHHIAPLMDRLNFMGDTFLIPIFLLSVGMMLDIRLFWSGWTVILLTLFICLLKLIGKGAAAYLAGALFHFKAAETELVFGMTQATAAGTLAVVTIGYQLQLFTDEMLTAAVLMILLLCTSASFLTEHAAKRIKKTTDS